MDFLKDRRVILAAGAVVAILLGVFIALSISARHKTTAAPPASQGGLVVEMGRPDDTKVSAQRQIRCFTNGQFVGELTISECASRNGVATGALDVGIDESGALSAGNTAGTTFAPLPPPAVGPVATPPAPAPAAPGAAPAAPPVAVSACQRYAGSSWSRMPGGDISLNACVQALYAGQCVQRGQATYGRWADQTLRLVPGKVEISADNRRFRTLVEQGSGCSIPEAN